ncbi:MAG: hypothetical protein HY721_30450 [Planctomycetes bacterium]|nr:hypothetical protein [Planctomycetota bacterium]
MKPDPSSGLAYVIATADGAPRTEGLRPVEARLLEATGARGGGSGGGAAERVERRELPGILWGWVPFEEGREPPGDRLTCAVRGPREALLRGDPVWLEQRSGRPCTAEELLRAWEAEGADAARLLDNISLAIVADAEAGELAIATDRMGGIALYAADIGGTRVLATSYLAVSRLAGAGAIDGDSIAAFFHLGFFPGTRTALRGVSVVPFATVTRLGRGGLRREPYWRPDMAVDRTRPVAEQLRGVLDAFHDTVRECSAGMESMLLAMTAGLDSRTVASSLIRQRIPFETYTHGYPGCPEVKGVERIVARHGIRHRSVPLAGDFTARLRELALESFAASEGTISCIEKSHLIHVQSLLRAACGPRTGLLLGGGAGMLKGTYYRLLRDRERHGPEDIDRYLAWNLAKRLPAVFAKGVPANDPRVLHELVARSLDEAGGGTFFQRLDYLYAVRYRRWAGGVKRIYRLFFPVREPFVSARLLDVLFRLDPAIKAAKLPHFEVLSRSFPALQLELTNKMTPALPFTLRTAWRFLPSLPWRAKQVLRGFSRRFLPRELLPLADYVDYDRWIREESGRALLDEVLDPARMRSLFLYGEGVDGLLRAWRERREGSFSLLDKMATLELYFRELRKP